MAKDCPQCEGEKGSEVRCTSTGVLPNSHVQKIMRQRRCKDCGYCWTTVEIDQAELIKMGLDVRAKRGRPKKEFAQ